MKSTASFARRSRRSFLKSTAVLAAATSLPEWFVERSLGAPAPVKAPGPNDQPAIALVGCGGMGQADARNASRFGRVVALCDVDSNRLAQAKEGYPDAKTYSDFRRVMDRNDIDVVICGTVDHWHVLVSMAAVNSGKDIYCEKPLTRTIQEGQRLIKTVHQSRRILQTGTQQRSDPRFRLACELVRNNRLGPIRHVDVWVPMGLRDGPFAHTPVPEGFDYEFWMGPTPVIDYVKERTHGTFRYWWDYAGGTVTDWGVHHNDIALWGLGMDHSGPVSIEGKALIDTVPGGYTAPREWRVDYQYASGITHTCQTTKGNGPYGQVLDADAQQHGIRFNGDNGWIFVTRGKIEASDPDLLSTPLPPDAVRLYESNDHMGNFFDCVVSRNAPIADVEIGHRSASICHIGVLAIRLGRKLTWNPEKEKFKGDREANHYLSNPMRKPWTFESVGG
ncbi:MAG: Gfo/Idh/MocA family oxidoreductase [Verrucomicrobiota bacterium]